MKLVLGEIPAEDLIVPAQGCKWKLVADTPDY
jgi:hypothetical protein